MIPAIDIFSRGKAFLPRSHTINARALQIGDAGPKIAMRRAVPSRARNRDPSDIPMSPHGSADPIRLEHVPARSMHLP